MTGNKKDTKSRQRVTLKDIAREAGVSVVTASHVLLKSKSQTVRVSKEKASLIQDIAKKLNYKPNIIARQLAGVKSNMIGVIMDASGPEFHKQILSKMEIYAAKNGFRFIIGQAHEDSKKLADYIEDFESRAVEGLIVLSHSYDKEKHGFAKKLANFKNTVFILEPKSHSDHLYCVQIDYFAGLKKSISYLKKAHYKKTAFFLYSTDHPSMLAREAGYIKALELENLPFDKNLIKKFSHQDLTNQNIKYLVKDCILHQKADSIIACDDKVAATIMKFLKELGISVPDQVGIIGHDNLDWCEFLNPSLATVDPMSDELAKQAMNLLISLLNNTQTKENIKIIVDPKLVIRESVRSIS